MLEPPPHEAPDQEQNVEKYYSIPKANLVPATIIFDCVKVTETATHD